MRNLKGLIEAGAIRLDELKGRVDAIQARGVTGTQLFQARKEYDYVRTIVDLMDIIANGGDVSNNTYARIEKAVFRHGTNKVQMDVAKGDTLMQVLQKNPNVKDVLTKLGKYCEANGMTFNTATGIVE